MVPIPHHFPPTMERPSLHPSPFRRGALRGILATLLTVGGIALVHLPRTSDAQSAPTARPGTSRGGDVLALDYRKSVESALAQNFEIRIERISPKIAAAQLKTAKGDFDPELQLSYTYSRSQQQQNTLNNNLDDGSSAVSQPDLFVENTGNEFDSGIVGLAPWGMTYDLGGSVVNSGDSRKEFDTYEPFVGLQLTQPLLRGFGTDVNLSAIRIARTNEAISDWELRKRVIDVITRTITAYNEYYYSIRNLEVERQSRDLARQTLEDNSRRAEIGVMYPLDITQARADVATRDERVLVAERQMLDNENALKQLVSDRTRSILNLRLQIAPPPSMKGFRFDKTADIGRSFSLRPDYRQTLLDLQNQKINIVVRRNETLPRLDLEASFGVNGHDRNLSGSVSNLSAANNTSATAGIIFRYPIGNRAAKGRLDEAKLTVAQQLLSLKNLEQQILIEIDNAAGQIDTTRKRIETTTAARVLAEETLKSGQARLASGTTTTFEVLQFQSDAAAARIAELRAAADHNIAIATYAQLTGTTLERAGVSIRAGM